MITIQFQILLLGKSSKSRNRSYGIGIACSEQHGEKRAFRPNGKPTVGGERSPPNLDLGCGERFLKKIFDTIAVEFRLLATQYGGSDDRDSPQIIFTHRS
jgi:hypothetical protein